jgi:predicted nucleic acid-binding protein
MNAPVHTTGYLMDTGVWVEVERGRLSGADIQALVGDAPVFLSPITIAELTAGVELADNEPMRQRRRAGLARLRSKPVLRIDAITGEIYGTLVATLQKSGRGSHRHRVQDLWMAAQAIQNSLCVVTYNRKDFQDVPGLDIHVLLHASTPTDNKATNPTP